MDHDPTAELIRTFAPLAILGLLGVRAINEAVILILLQFFYNEARRDALGLSYLRRPIIILLSTDFFLTLGLGFAFIPLPSGLPIWIKVPIGILLISMGVVLLTLGYVAREILHRGKE